MAGTTWNPADKSASITLSGGNLIAAGTSGVNSVRSVDQKTTGKFYWEITATAFANSSSAVGVATLGWALSSGITSPTGGLASGVSRSGLIYANGSALIALGAIASGTIVCFAIDLVAGTIWIRSGAAGPWNNNASFSPAAGTGGVSLGASAGTAFYVAATLSGDTVTLNSGDSAFAGAVPSTFTAGWPSAVAAAQARVLVLA
jgi:hypothetical protein